MTRRVIPFEETPLGKSALRSEQKEARTRHKEINRRRALAVTKSLGYSKRDIDRDERIAKPDAIVTAVMPAAYAQPVYIDDFRLHVGAGGHIMTDSGELIL